MPTYSYECKKCGKLFDVFHSISATPLVKCEDCGGSTKRLLGTGAGIIFKGSGFYETDYKKSSGGGSGATDRKSGEGKSSDSKSPESKSSESKSSDSKGSTSSSSEAKSSPAPQKRPDTKK